MRELEKFVRLSKYVGERFDLVQAGGGNLSIKLNRGQMLIKASGFNLSEVDFNKGWVKVDLKQIKAILTNKNLQKLNERESREKLAVKLLNDSALSSEERPSMETFLHALLNKYTLHVHPLAASIVVSTGAWQQALIGIFRASVALVKYRTPGIELALEAKRVVEEYQNNYSLKPKLIFLENHGLIVTAGNYQELVEFMEKAIKKLERYLKINLDKYKMTNQISALANSVQDNLCSSYLSFDNDLGEIIKTKKKILFRPPFCPDGLVYCGWRPLKLSNLKDKRPFVEYFNKYSGLPKVVIYKRYIFFLARNTNKAREIADVFKFQVLVRHLSKKRVHSLGKDELCYLSRLEAEKYRQNR